MSLSIHVGGSQLAFLSLSLLCLILTTVRTHPLDNPTADGPLLGSALLYLQAALEEPRNSEPIPKWPQDPLPVLVEPIEDKERGGLEEAVLRAQRGDFMDAADSPFMGDNSVESIYQEAEGGEGGARRNNPLTSIAGGLQAVSREKGGFGFRFGRKRLAERGWRD